KSDITVRTKRTIKNKPTTKKQIASTAEKVNPIGDTTKTIDNNRDSTNTANEEMVKNKRRFEEGQFIEIETPSTKKLKRASSTDARFKCNKCGSIFSCGFGLRYHCDNVHTIEKDQVLKKFNCPFEDCSRKYKNNNGLKYHLNKFHQAIYTSEQPNIDDY
ncbi:Zinc finger C2H2 protein, partial [Nosema granulosis]